jgi:hypothetical protein
MSCYYGRRVSRRSYQQASVFPTRRASCNAITLALFAHIPAQAVEGCDNLDRAVGSGMMMMMMMMLLVTIQYILVTIQYILVTIRGGQKLRFATVRQDNKPPWQLYGK